MNDAPPTASFSHSCTGLVCSFDGSSSSDDNGIVAYAWDFGDDSTSSDSLNVRHGYQSAGTYTVTLTVEDTVTQAHVADTSVQVRNKGKTKGGTNGGADGGNDTGNCPPAEAAKGKC